MCGVRANRPATGPLVHPRKATTVLTMCLNVYCACAHSCLQVPHQDSTFLYTDPPTCTGLWLALEDTTRSNGCLWGLKGVHKQGLSRRFKRLPQGGVGFDGPPAEYDLSQFEPIECAAGTLVLLHGANVHYR